MDLKPSPFAPTDYPELDAIGGFRLGVAATGVKYKGRNDLLVVEMAEGTTVAGVYTRSKCPSAPVDWCKAHLAGGSARALVVNASNANAFTGSAGVKTTTAVANAAAEACGGKPSEVFMASTGVIGEPLDPAPITSLFGTLFDSDKTNASFMDAARAIMTTDTFVKAATASADIDGTTVTIHGIAKGSGMIAPDMATMLGFVFTDAPVAAEALQALLSRHVDTSFNAITVDSDTSTSDTLMVFASGAAKGRGCPVIEKADDARLEAFSNALSALLQDLAKMVVRDGEGASKFLEITVSGAENDAAAKRVALAIANSPLVKTAAAGEDANWGRVVAAVGKAGEMADRDKLAIWFGPFRLAVDGMRDPDYSEEVASAYMKNDEIEIRADLGIGSGKATVWTCDLTHGYIAINGDYRS
ncbi:bifunctional glutamate N-acetyltransferase/amino-acid acetyltransferase ArgJ [uncultured Cohaesibacter sp.]|uniref:bifunctional glutamate N-acetyltransferase/amino-acid acetyltransferase ArgJ n=1 Tax=uncultured Cohaesibacter sp. TaxID=1002546 RepID=UPI0029C6D029|nr:bifunctional glutamate N-acetyltransferase/amino-acid acetyltransferase ArgJ [uncultured Cohaesibacter sp.]